MKSFSLKTASAFSFLIPACAGAAVVTGSFSNSNYVTTNGVSEQGSTNASRYNYVAGNATSQTNIYPAFTVFYVNGASILSSLDTANGTPGGTVSSINSLTLNLTDQLARAGNHTPTAGSLVFSYATNATALAVQASSPVFDTTQIGGLSTQLGPLDSLGTATYTPAATVNTTEFYSLSGAAGYNDIVNAIDSGSTFYIAVSAGTATTAAAFGGWYGVSPSLNPSNFTIDANVSPVPEPASLGFLAVGAMATLSRRRRV